MHEMDGPKVVILEQVREHARNICRIGTCYLGATPPSSLVYFNNAYDLNDLDVSDTSKSELKNLFVLTGTELCLVALKLN